MGGNVNSPGRARIQWSNSANFKLVHSHLRVSSKETEWESGDKGLGYTFSDGEYSVHRNVGGGGSRGYLAVAVPKQDFMKLKYSFLVMVSMDSMLFNNLYEAPNLFKK
jgi:hypothetical protein